MASIAQFAEHRARLFAIAHRTLGSPWAADDAVQETWLRLQRTDVAGIRNLEAWLTTVVSRVCVDLIRRDASRREDSHPATDVPLVVDPAPGPPEEVMLAEDLALAMQVVLEALGPLERLALVLHDVFGLSYDDIAPVVERTPVAARQLASRARARLRTVDVRAVREQQHVAISAFLDAARRGEFGQLLQLLDPDIRLRSDNDAIALATAGADHGAPKLAASVHGRDAVARVFAGRAELARTILVSGIPAAAYVIEDTVHAVYLVTLRDGRITGLEVLADPDYVSALGATP